MKAESVRRTIYECGYCGIRWGTKVGAVMCCGSGQSGPLPISVRTTVYRCPGCHQVHLERWRGEKCCEVRNDA